MIQHANENIFMEKYILIDAKPLISDSFHDYIIP